MPNQIINIRKSATGLFCIGLIAACASVAGSIKDSTYTAPNGYFSVALPRPQGTHEPLKYEIREQESGGVFGVWFGPSFVDPTAYEVLLIPKSIPRSAHKQSGKTGELSDEEIRKLTLSVSRAGQEKQYRAAPEIVTQETFTDGNRTIDYLALRQLTAQAMGRRNLGGKPFDLYHGIYVFSTTDYTVQFTVSAIGKDDKSMNRFKDRSFGNMQRVFESIQLLGTSAMAEPSKDPLKGRDLYISGHFKEAQAVLEATAQDNDPYAQAVLALLYTNGYAGTKDIDKAQALAQRSAKSNNGIALHVLFSNYKNELKNETESKKHLELSWKPLIEAALHEDPLAQGLIAWQIINSGASIPEGVWKVAGEQAGKIPPAARAKPEQYFAARAAQQGFGLGYRLLGMLDGKGGLDLDALGPGGSRLYKLRFRADEDHSRISYVRRAALLGDPVAIRGMDQSFHSYSSENRAEERKRVWGLNRDTDRQETSVGLGLSFSDFVVATFKLNGEQIGEFSGDCDKATDTLDMMVLYFRRMNLAKLGASQAFTGYPPRRLTEKDKRELVAVYGSGGRDLIDLLIRIGDNLYKARIACDSDPFFAKVLRRLAE